MSDTHTTPSAVPFAASLSEIFAPLRTKALLVGIAASVLTVFGFATNRAQFFDAYLFAYLFVLGIALGSMALVMLHHMTGGDWGYCIRRITEASAMTLPLLTILFIPIALGTKYLFPWTNSELTHGDAALAFQVKVWMYNPFWLIRAAVYFAVWNGIAFALWRSSSNFDRSGDPRVNTRVRMICAPGLLLYVLTMTFAAVDWIQSRESHWYSSIIGLVTCVGQGLSGLIMALAVLRLARRDKSLAGYLTPPRLNDLGNLFLALTILWTYMSFAQLLIIWMGNTAVDSPWYIRRGFSGLPDAPHGWQGVALFLLLAHFAFPFFTLLGRVNKRQVSRLSALAAFVLLMRVVDNFWWSGPSSMLDVGHEQMTTLTQRSVHWLDFVTPVALFGIWFSVMLTLVQKRPLLAREEIEAGSHKGVSHAAHAAA